MLWRLKLRLRTLDNGNLFIEEDLNGGYTQRGMHFNLHIEGEWTKDIQLVKLTINDVDATAFVLRQTSIFSDESAGRTAVRAYNRHIKQLKIHLGVEQPKPKVNKLFIYKYYGGIDKLQVDPFELTQTGGPKKGKTGMLITEATPEKLKVVDEYNAKFKEFKQYFHEVLTKLELK